MKTRLLSTLLVAVLSLGCAHAQTTFVPKGATWKYLDDGSDQGAAWRAPAFDDSAWASGAAKLGYGDDGEATVVSSGPGPGVAITTYFRKSFEVANPATIAGLKLELLRDDGAVVYLNGVEVARSNMPPGEITATTPAASTVSWADETTNYFPSILDRALLVAGTNVLAVELHQVSAGSSDLGMDLRLWDGVVPPPVARGPYLQMGTPTSILIRWRSTDPTNGRVRYGTAPDALTSFADDATVARDHAIPLTGLTPGTPYWYSVGTSTATLAGGADFHFITAPPAGTAQPTRIWVLGDSGTADATAAAVRDGFASFSAGARPDVWLMLGDDAYPDGTDEQFQAAVFDMYPSYLRRTVLWSTIGNHETVGSTNPPLTIPYFQIFTLPTAGEAGGVPSGTEKYYSFDHARIHFVCLDSMTSSRQPGSPMLTWLEADLASTTQDWIVAYWHHPPYSKGSHDSDNEAPLIEMRENILPILEAGGVDLVLTGHSHNYERSYLLDGHYGPSTTLSPTMKLNGGDGREGGNGAYVKPTGLAGNQGAVHVVAGNGGHVTVWAGGSSAEFNPAPHPAMFYSALHVGSLVIDVAGERMDVKMIRETGAIDDFFSIVKNRPNVAPTITLTAPGAGAAFTAPASITLAATAADADGTVRQVDFYSGNAPIGSALNAPFGLVWNEVAVGNYALSAAATDDRGATTPSNVVNISVLPPAPIAPTGLVATAGNAQVTLAWTASAGATGYKVKRATTAGGPYTTLITGLTSDAYTDTGLTNGATYFYVVSALNAGGESGNSAQASATPTAPLTIPAAPTELTAYVISQIKIYMEWRDNADNETGYRLERSSDGTNFFQLAETANPDSFSNGELPPNTLYYYRVRAYNAAGNSAYSNIVSARTLP